MLLQLVLSLMSCIDQPPVMSLISRTLSVAPDLFYSFLYLAPLELDPKPTLKWLTHTKLVKSVRKILFTIVVLCVECSLVRVLMLLCCLSENSYCSIFCLFFSSLRCPLFVYSSLFLFHSLLLVAEYTESNGFKAFLSSLGNLCIFHLSSSSYTLFNE